MLSDRVTLVVTELTNHEVVTTPCCTLRLGYRQYSMIRSKTLAFLKPTHTYIVYRDNITRDPS